MTDGLIIDGLNAVVRISEILERVEPDDRRRVLDAVAAYYGESAHDSRRAGAHVAPIWGDGKHDFPKPPEIFCQTAGKRMVKT